MKILIYDTKQGYLSTIWSIGSFITNFDVVLPVESWQDVYDYFTYQHSPVGLLDMIQLWGHGRSGEPLINGEGPDLPKLQSALKGKTDNKTVLWFRSCDVFLGKKGHAFAEQATSLLNIRVVGHTFIISLPWPTHQSGGHALRPGEEAYWPLDEGLKADGTLAGSTPFKPNTCLATRMTVPNGWWL